MKVRRGGHTEYDEITGETKEVRTVKLSGGRGNVDFAVALKDDGSGNMDEAENFFARAGRRAERGDQLDVFDDAGQCLRSFILLQDDVLLEDLTLVCDEPAKAEGNYALRLTVHNLPVKTQAAIFNMKETGRKLTVHIQPEPLPKVTSSCERCGEDIAPGEGMTLKEGGSICIKCMGEEEAQAADVGGKKGKKGGQAA